MFKTTRLKLIAPKLLAVLLAVFALTACSTPGRGLNDSLRYTDKRQFDTDLSALKKLEDMKKGEACTWNFLFLIPIFGDGSLLTAAKAGQINDVDLVGEYGAWRFPFNKECTVVYGDSIAVNQSANVGAEIQESDVIENSVGDSHKAIKEAYKHSNSNSSSNDAVSLFWQ